MERIKVGSLHDVPSHFAITAITNKMENNKVVLENGRSPDGYIHITFMVEGVEVDFVGTIKDIYQRMTDDMNRKAAELAYEQCKLHGLNKLVDLVDQFDYEIRTKLEEVFGVKLGDDR